jgi:hypothetical protein
VSLSRATETVLSTPTVARHPPTANQPLPLARPPPIVPSELSSHRAAFGAEGTTMTKHTPPDHIDDLPPLNADELFLLSIETRFGRIADALENVAKIKAAGRDDIVGLTAQVNRLADAFESVAGLLGCLTEDVEGQDGKTRCVIRTRDTVPGALSMRDDGSED